MLIDRGEEIAVSRYRLGQAQEEIPVRLQGVMEDGDHPSLQIRVEIDEQVAAGDEVQPRERRVPQDAVGRENAEIADLLHQLIGMSVRNEKPLQALRRDIRQQTPRI